MSKKSTMQAHVTLTDGNEYDVTIIMADLARYDILRARNNFPPRNESTFLFMCIATFCAMKRTGQIGADTKLEPFIETVEAIDSEDDDAAEGDAEGAEFRTDTDD